jgi:hypothetical protein
MGGTWAHKGKQAYGWENKMVQNIITLSRANYIVHHFVVKNTNPNYDLI